MNDQEIKIVERARQYVKEQIKEYVRQNDRFPYEDDLLKDDNCPDSISELFQELVRDGEIIENYFDTSYCVDIQQAQEEKRRAGFRRWTVK